MLRGSFFSRGGLPGFTGRGPGGGGAGGGGGGALTWDSGTTDYNPDFTIAGIVEGSAGSLNIYSNAALTILFDTSPFGPVTAFEAEDGSITLPDISTLDFGTQYWAQALVDAVLTNVVTKTMAVQTPVLILPTTTGIGGTTATVGITTDVGNGALRLVVSNVNVRPSDPQFDAGQDSTGGAAIFTNNPAIASPGAKTAAVTGLLVSATYYPFWRHTSATGGKGYYDGTSFTTTDGVFTPAEVPGIKDFFRPKSSKLFKDAAGLDPVTLDGDLIMLHNSEMGVLPARTASGASRPIYRTAGGLEWIEFAGSQFLDFTGTGLGGVASYAGPFYWFVAAKVDVLGGTYGLTDGVSGARASIFTDFDLGVNYWRLFGSTSVNDWGHTPTTADVVIGALFDGATSTIRVEGVTGATQNSGTASLESGGRIGAFFTGGGGWDGRYYGDAIIDANPSNTHKANLDTWGGARQGRVI